MAWHHRLIAKVLNRFPSLAEKLTLRAVKSVASELPAKPWQPITQAPFQAKLMLVTTGGVHTPEQPPFDMGNSHGDTSFRWIPKNQSDFRITHDYYDHTDADADINCLFPLPLANRLSENGLIGSLTSHHPSFMGHIEDPLVPEFLDKRLPDFHSQFKDQLKDPPDLVVLSPA